MAEARDRAGASGSPGWLWLGVGLVGICWPLNWALPGLRAHFLFFPLWLGYILIVDGLVLLRSGSSLLRRSPRDLARLFVASAPVWWIFEALNQRLGSWEYLGKEGLDPVSNVVWSTLAYSTVIPAVCVTAELLGTGRWSDRFRRRRRLVTSPGGRAAIAAAGLAMLALLLAWPRYFYPLTWVSLALLLDPLAHRLGRPSLLGHLERGAWRPLVLLPVAALTCGFFWELWNYWAYPKWVYHIPGLGFARLFELPALGYLGYLPFGLELYPFLHLILRRPPDLRL